MKSYLLSIPGVFFLLLLAAVVAILLFYAEENTRGALEWTQTERELRNHGENPDFSALIPPPIPDEQNLGVIPLFKMEPEGQPPTMQAVALTKALANVMTDAFPQAAMGNWSKGEPADMRTLQKYLDDRCRATFGKTGTALGPMETIDQLCPALNELRQASTLRPLVRIDEDYTTQPAFSRSSGISTRLLKLAKVLNLHAVAALHEHQAVMALDDMKLSLKLAAGLRREPMMIPGLVGAALVSIQLESVWEGLGQRAWNDSQLKELQDRLEEIDFLSDYQFCMRGEADGMFAQINDYLRDHPWQAGPLILGMHKSDADDSPGTSLHGRILVWLIPSGWYDMSKSRGVALEYQAARTLADPLAHRADPKGTAEMVKRIESSNILDLPNFMTRLSVPAVLTAIEQFSLLQVRVDCARLACGLERYRLAHHTYPKTLDDIAPYVPGSLPTDPLSGRAYHYRLLQTGDYLLYSIGWNQVDDGGKTAYLPGSPSSLDKDNGDWVWPVPAYSWSH